MRAPKHLVVVRDDHEVLRADLKLCDGGFRFGTVVRHVESEKRTELVARRGTGPAHRQRMRIGSRHDHAVFDGGDDQSMMRHAFEGHVHGGVVGQPDRFRDVFNRDLLAVEAHGVGCAAFAGRNRFFVDVGDVVVRCGHAPRD